jgi:uncharacterized repeat protein (TIGR03987 family)
MNDVIIRAIIVVTLALICYSIGVISEQRKAQVTRRIILFITAGVLLDIASTVLMIAGSTNTPLTVHGCLGYSALLLMLIDAILIWRHWIRSRDVQIPRNLHLYTRIAYGWWVIAYIVGAVMSSVLA